MKFPLYDQTWQGFEGLILEICRDILGIGVKEFSNGRDGGRDGWFEGTASKFPSDKDSWKGSFCIQVKHTEEINLSCSDDSFSSQKRETSTLSKELKRLKILKTEQDFENYLLFTNRKLSATQNEKMQKWFRKELGIQNVEFFGIEMIQRYITPTIATKTKLYDLMQPLRFYEKDIQDVIIGFSAFHKSPGIADLVAEYRGQFVSIDKTKKNELNRMSEDYFEIIKSKSLQYFKGIMDFLQNPLNGGLLEKYRNTASDLDAQIALHRDQYAGFERIMESLIERIIEDDPERLRPQRRVVRIFLHFMYFNCDIGRTE